MYILIFTVFVAELIIGFAIIQNIFKLDKKVISANIALIEARTSVEDVLLQAKNGVYKSKNSVECSIDYLYKKRNEYTRKIIQNIILYITMIFCKGRYKQAAIFFQLIVAIRDYINDTKI